jgi:hypothetical protein
LFNGPGPLADGAADPVRSRYWITSTRLHRP